MHIMKRLETQTAFSPHEWSILLATKRKSSLATYIFVYSTQITLAVLLLNALIQTKRSLLWPSIYPIDWQANIAWYVLALVFQVVCTFHIIMPLIFVDMWRVAAFFLLDGFLDVLRGRMQGLGWSTSANLQKFHVVMVASKQHRLHEKELIDCVKYHLLYLRCVHYTIE